MEYSELNGLEHDFEIFAYSEIENKYEEFLDEIYPDQYAFGEQLWASDYRKISPVTFRCGCADYSSDYYKETNEGWMLKDEYAELEGFIEDKISELEEAIEEYEDIESKCAELSDCQMEQIAEARAEKLREQIDYLKEYL